MKQKTPYQLLLILLLSYTVSARAQLISGNVFLKGNYVRLGLTSNGAFGSTVDAPNGFVPYLADSKNSPSCNWGKIGFVADPDTRNQSLALHTAEN